MMRASGIVAFVLLSCLAGCVDADSLSRVLPEPTPAPAPDEGGTDDDGADSTQPAPAPDPGPVSPFDPDHAVTFRFSVEHIPGGNGALGSVFTYRADEHTVTCGAGFVAHAGTRIYGNQNDVEFWCRNGPPAPLEWIPVGRPSWRPTALVGNIDGTLFDYVSNARYDFLTGSWRVDRAAGGIDTGSSGLYSLRDDDRRWAIAHNYRGCTGYAVLGTDGYVGTVAFPELPSAITVWRGALYVNAGAIWRAELPDDRPIGCRYLDAEVLVEDPNWVYTMFPVGDRLLIGGGGHTFVDAELYDCAPLYSTDGVEVEVIELDGCAPLEVTEIYSATMFDDAVYFGTFPDGYLYRLEPGERKATRSGLPLLPNDTWDQDGRRYLESQAVAVAGGRLFVGMFPWGELYEHGDTDVVYRLFDVPERSAEQQPFGAEANAHYCFGNDTDAPDCVEDDRPEFWGQRVTSIAVLDGLVCAATGNTFGTPYSPARHAFVAPEIAAAYGRVHCAALPDQTLARVPFRDDVELTFAVTDDGLFILHDDDLLAWNPHGLPEDAMHALRSGDGELVVGAGPYGPTQAAIRQLNS